MALSASKKIALERDYRCPAVYTSDLQRDTHVPAIAARHYIDLGVNWQISGCVRMTCGGSYPNSWLCIGPGVICPSFNIKVAERYLTID